MTHSISLPPPRRLLLTILAGTILFLSAMSISFAQSASADWFCSQNGAKPWEHYNHWFLYVDDMEHRYVSGHTHTNGEHHHIWETWKNWGFTYVGETHANCGV
ncbi:MAG TPA: hypothetical protein VF520_00220 [Thermoleophilaceae bacterium]|jgi:hypothetical protein